MDDLSLLQNVRSKFTSGNDVPVPEARVTRAEWEAIDARLGENTEWRALVAEWRAKAAVFETERDALRKRIDESRRVTIGAYPAHGFGYVQMICDPAKGISDKVYALVPLDDAEAAP